MKEVIIQIPDDCEIKIVKKEEKKKETIIRTYEDLILYNKPIQGVYITPNSVISSRSAVANLSTKNLATSEKIAKSMLAMAMISQLMPYYGGVITKEEWDDVNQKYIIQKSCNRINCIELSNTYYYLSFHTKKQRDEFLQNNEQLVKDYLMLD